MKLRLGFCSNSSSSSFMIGICVLDNVEKFKKYVANKVKDLSTISFTPLKELKDGDRHNEAHYDATNKKVYIEGFTYHSEEVYLKDIIRDSVDDTATAKTMLLGFDNCIVASFYESGDEPSYDEDTDSYNYDEVNTGWFNEDSQKLYKIFNSESKIPGMLKGAAGMGAGRDG